jgi:chromosome segregation ATPase
MSEDRTTQLPDDGVRLILARLDLLDGRMTALEERVDRRLQETRPIWEQVLARLTQVETRLGNVETRLGAVEEEVYALKRKFRVYIEDQIKREDRQDDLKERQDEFEVRLSRLESKPAQ